MYKYSDNNENNDIILHDCRADKLLIGEKSISFVFGEGFYVSEKNRNNYNKKQYSRSVTSISSISNSNIKLVWPVEVNEDDFPSKIYNDDEYTIAIRGQHLKNCIN